MSHRALARILPFVVLLPAAAAQTQITISSSQDNTLYESKTGARSNGMGSRFFCGVNGNGEARRGVIAFDVAGAVPPCATIVSAELDLECVMSVSGAVSCRLHRVQESWGEGASVATYMGQGGGGTAAANDATWIHRFFPGTSWTNAGGTYAATASGSAAVGGTGPYTWTSTPEIVADVQAWLDTSSANHGWLLRTDEMAPFTAKGFATKEEKDPALRPALRITYMLPEARNDTTGTGCAGSGASPLALSANQRPSLPSPGYQLSLAGGPAGPSVFLLTGGLLPVPIPLGGGCAIYVDVTGPTLALAGTAARTLPLPIPANPALSCLRLPVQGVVVDTTTGGLVTSNALTLVFGS